MFGKIFKLMLFVVLAMNLNELITAQSLLTIPVKNLDGTTTTLSETGNNQIIALDFWATWCKPCVKSIPKFIELSDKYKDKGVVFIGINEDSPRNISKVKPFVNSLNINYPVLLDPDQELMSELLVGAFPTLVIVNNEGRILFLHEGFVPGDEKIIEDEIIKALENSGN